MLRDRALRFSFRAVVSAVAQHLTSTLFAANVEGNNQTRQQQHRGQFNRQNVWAKQRDTHFFRADWRTVDARRSRREWHKQSPPA